MPGQAVVPPQTLPHAYSYPAVGTRGSTGHGTCCRLLVMATLLTLLSSSAGLRRRQAAEDAKALMAGVVGKFENSDVRRHHSMPSGSGSNLTRLMVPPLCLHLLLLFLPCRCWTPTSARSSPPSRRTCRCVAHPQPRPTKTLASLAPLKQAYGIEGGSSGDEYGIAASIIPSAEPATYCGVVVVVRAWTRGSTGRPRSTRGSGMT